MTCVDVPLNPSHSLMLCVEFCSFCVHQLFTSNLVTRSASTDHHAADVDRSVAEVEHARIRGVTDREMFDPSECMFIVSVLCLNSIC